MIDRLCALARDKTIVALTGAGLGDALMTLVAAASEAGLDAELELRAAARRFADAVHERERQADPAAG